MASHPLDPPFQVDGLGGRYLIRVDAPPKSAHAGRSPGDAPCPVLLCLDGDDQFEILRKARTEAANKQPLSPLLLVGVGYGASYQEPGNHRIRDYTPCPIEGEPEGGGAEAFHDFLVTTLWPELARRYSISHDTRGVAGHSLGGLFGLHALFRPRPFFNRVLASSPSLWWGERAVLAAATSLHATGVPLPARLFLSVGARDSASMVDDLDLLESRLAAAPFRELVIGRERFPRKKHFDAIEPGFRAGLAFLFSET